MRAQRESGYTLIELIIVVTVLAVIAAIAVPATTSTESRKQLALVAHEFAAALRFARSEAIRTGEPHGFRFLTSHYRIQIFSVDTSSSPWTTVLNIYHPVDKQLFDYTLPAKLVGGGTPITHVPVFRGSCNTQGDVYFDANGTPWCLEPETVLLDSYRLDIVIGADQVSVDLYGITGKVTVQ